MWKGDPARGREPWRDTGIEIVGPATAYGERGFAASWALTGGQLDLATIPDESDIPAAGPVSLRLIYTEPFSAAMLRARLRSSMAAKRGATAREDALRAEIAALRAQIAAHQ